ncbi:hypothetical protein JHK84_028555 [Glycine max]|nr:hypothetical protein JHK86_028426 [Glycine max]KAG5152083.1 hypothetical protein JHK84_028555 [Glycine max]
MSSLHLLPDATTAPNSAFLLHPHSPLFPSKTQTPLCPPPVESQEHHDRLHPHREVSEVIRSTNRGYPLVLNKPPTLAGLAFEQAAWRLVEQDSMQIVMVEEQPKQGFFSFFGG